MDPEIQPLTNKVNKIEQKLEEQEQRIDLLEHEEAAMEQKMAMEEIVNPAETILIDNEGGELVENTPTKIGAEAEPVVVIDHHETTQWQRWLTEKNIIRASMTVLVIGFIWPFIFGLGASSLFTPSLIFLIDLGVVALALYLNRPKLVILGLIGTVITYTAWFFSSDPGAANPDLLTSFWFVAGYFVILSSLPAIRIGWQKKKLAVIDLWLIDVNSLLLFTAIFFLFRDTFVGALSFFAVILLIGNAALIAYYFYIKRLPLKILAEKAEGEPEESE